MFSFLFIFMEVSAKEVKLDASNYTIKPGETMSLDIIVDSEDDIKSGSFMITTSSRNIGFEKIEFEIGIKRKVNGSSYTFEVEDGVLKPGSKIATVTLVAKESTKEGAKTTIVLSQLKVKNKLGKTEKFDTISQVVTCTNEDQKSSNNDLKEITSPDFDLTFDKNKLSYEVEVGSDVKEVNLDAKAEDEKAEVNIEKGEFKNGVSTVKITVTAENSETKEYTIQVKQKQEKTETVSKTESDTKPKGYKGKWVLITIFIGAIVVLNLFLLKKDK